MRPRLPVGVQARRRWVREPERVHELNSPHAPRDRSDAEGGRRVTVTRDPPELAEIPAERGLIGPDAHVPAGQEGRRDSRHRNLLGGRNRLVEATELVLDLAIEHRQRAPPRSEVDEDR